MPTHFRSALAILLIAPLCAVAETPAERPWSLRPVVRPQIPVADTDGWARNPIDAFVWQRLAAAKITPSAAANQRTLVRRAWFDLLGLPPGHLLPDTDILANPGRWAAEVDRLLANPHYGERWGRHWLDVAGYADSCLLYTSPSPRD